VPKCIQIRLALNWAPHRQPHGIRRTAHEAEPIPGLQALDRSEHSVKR
jgi:hypothetical protein